MTGFLAELGTKLAERWVALLVLPGLLFTGAATVAVELGQRHAFDAGLLRTQLARLGTGQDGVVLVIAALVVSLGSGFAAQALGRPVESVLVGRWPARLARPLIDRRTARWQRLDAEFTADPERIALAAARNRVSLAPPAAPTWTGDRMLAPSVRVRKEYGLDLAAAWPRLWLVLPDSTREPLTESRRRFDDATVVGGWSVLYLVLGAVWWPSVLVAGCVAVVAWRRAIATADVYAELVEAAVDVHLDDLLDRFAADDRPVSPQRGRAVSERFRKGV
jgi:hypothetical protein